MLTLVYNKLKKNPSDSDKFNVFFILFPLINGVYLMLIVVEYNTLEQAKLFISPT